MATLTLCAISKQLLSFLNISLGSNRYRISSESDHSLFIHKFKSPEELFATNAPILLASTDNIERKIGAYENANLAAMLIKSGVLAIVGREAKTNNSTYIETNNE